MEENKDVKINVRKIIYNVLIVIFAIIALGSAIYLIKYYYTNSKGEQEYSKIKEMVDDSVDSTIVDKTTKELYKNIDGANILVKYAKLYEANPDFVGWLTIEDTHIDYPVMQTPEDEEYYIKRDFNKDYASYGALFVDGESRLGIYNPEKNSYDIPYTSNVIIYGHNMNAGTMFHDLVKYEDEDFYNSHKTFKFDTIYEEGTYEVIAAFRSEIYDEDSTNFKYYSFIDTYDSEVFGNYIKNIKALNTYNIDATAEYSDTLVTLSTCAYHTDNGRFVVIAKKIN